MKYELELDDTGNRYWLCTLDDGTQEAIPPGWKLELGSGSWTVEGTNHGLPIGTVVAVEFPENPEERKKESLLKLLRRSLQKSFKAEGLELSDEEADEKIQQTIDEILEKTKNPDVLRAKSSLEIPEPPQILPGEQKIVDQLIGAGFGRHG